MELVTKILIFFKNVSQEYLQIPKKYYNFQENDKGKEQRED